MPRYGSIMEIVEFGKEVEAEWIVFDSYDYGHYIRGDVSQNGTVTRRFFEWFRGARHWSMNNSWQNMRWQLPIPESRRLVHIDHALAYYAENYASHYEEQCAAQRA